MVRTGRTSPACAEIASGEAECWEIVLENQRQQARMTRFSYQPAARRLIARQQ